MGTYEASRLGTGGNHGASASRSSASFISVTAIKISLKRLGGLGLCERLTSIVSASAHPDKSRHLTG
ncbi:hypothetical protein SAMN05444581_1213 [Methylocapsa palsarum]|uniref:Uncharacterized protein n=1 Tax=Methylocapsa palsarum TaxID=1612308 RepID=A0A1I4CE90_9HYPH|nr:hypothetical protein SAMN05444581_1213 [Methylocapsa palsarum]